MNDIEPNSLGPLNTLTVVSGPEWTYCQTHTFCSDRIQSIAIVLRGPALRRSPTSPRGSSTPTQSRAFPSEVPQPLLNLTVESADKSIRKKEAAGTVIPSHLLAFSGARCRTRTCDLRLRRPTLYPAQLIALEHSSSRKIFPRRGTVNHSAAGASSPGRPKAPGLSLSRRRRCRPPVRPRRPRARRRGPPGGIRPRWGR